MSEEIAIEVRNLHKSFKKNEVLKGLDLTVPRGKVFALLGQNGAGKTTMVKILSTLLKYDRGHVRVLSHDLPQGSTALRSKISMTGQYVALDEELTGEQNLILIARLCGYPLASAKSRAKELLELFDLAEAGKKVVKTYSGGMHRRLDIAAGIIKTPELLFLDEPTTGLDPRSRAAVWEFVRKLAQNGTTVFLTTQYLEEADRLADLIAVIAGGKIVAQGTPSELKNLVGRKTIKIRFQESAQCDRARLLLHQAFLDDSLSAPESDLQKIRKKVEAPFPDDNLSASETDLLTMEISDISQANTVLTKLVNADIEPMEYVVSQAGLDEVFMTFTSKDTVLIVP